MRDLNRDIALIEIDRIPVDLVSRRAKNRSRHSMANSPAEYAGSSIGRHSSPAARPSRGFGAYRLAAAIIVVFASIVVLSYRYSASDSPGHPAGHAAVSGGVDATSIVAPTTTAAGSGPSVAVGRAAPLTSAATVPAVPTLPGGVAGGVCGDARGAGRARIRVSRTRSGRPHPTSSACSPRTSRSAPLIRERVCRSWSRSRVCRPTTQSMWRSSLALPLAQSTAVRRFCSAPCTPMRPVRTGRASPSRRSRPAPTR